LKAISEMNQAELAAYVQNHLSARGVEVVLSGGAVVGIYSDGLYVSKDIDLINVFFADRRQIEATMREIGFVPVGRHFEHPDSNQIFEFPPGPLSIGNEKVAEIAEIIQTTGLLRTLSPTDCIKDRLAHYFHWGDRQCLAQAKLVAANQDFDLEEVQDWAKREGQSEAFINIKDDLI
jgi:hypothetical protein